MQLSDEEQKTVLDHLIDMANKPGWMNAQKGSAKVAVNVIAELKADEQKPQTVSMAENLPVAESKPGLKPWQKIVLIGTVVLLLAVALVVSTHSILVKLPVGADFYTFWLAARAAFLQQA